MVLIEKGYFTKEVAFFNHLKIKNSYHLLKPSLKDKPIRPAGVLSPIRITGAIWILERTKNTPPYRYSIPISDTGARLILVLDEVSF